MKPSSGSSDVHPLWSQCATNGRNASMLMFYRHWRPMLCKTHTPTLQLGFTHTNQDTSSRFCFIPYNFAEHTETGQGILRLSMPTGHSLILMLPSSWSVATYSHQESEAVVCRATCSFGWALPLATSFLISSCHTVKAGRRL